LPSASATTLSKETLPVPRCAFFAECYGHGTRQKTYLPNVTLDKVIRIPFYYLCLLLHPNKQKTYHIIITDIHHRYHRIITYIIHTTYLIKTINLTNITTSNKFEHKHKPPTLTNISLKYLTKYYQHQQVQIKLCHKVLTTPTNIRSCAQSISVRCAAGLVRRQARQFMRGCLMPPIVPAQRRDCMCETK
jgi:hypothetical protein